MAKDQTTPDLPPKKGTVLSQLSIKRARRYSDDKKARAGATPPTGPKPAPPPKTLSPAQLTQAAVTPQVTQQVTPQVPPTPPPPPGAGEATAEGNILEMLFARALRNRADTKPADDPGMAMLQALAHQVQTGQPLKDIEGIVVPHLGEMASKIHLFLNALAYHNMFERGALLSLARWTLEKSLWEDLINQRLSPVEKLALLQLAIKESDKIQSNLGEYQVNLEKGGKGTAADIESAVEKPDRALHKTEDPGAKDLEGTSPVGRELARRIMGRAGKASEQIVADALKNQKPV